MKFLAAVLGVMLGAGALFMAFPTPACADVGVSAICSAAPEDVCSTDPALPGTGAEAREYARREAASPEVQDFTGGEVIIGVSLGLVLLIVLLIVLID